MQVLWLTVGDGGLTFEAGNGTEALTQMLDHCDRVADAGEAGIPIRLLSRVVSALPDGPVKLSATEGFVTISAGSFVSRFPELSSDDADRTWPCYIGL